MKKLLSSVADFLADQSGFLRLTYDQTPGGGMAPNATFSIVQETGDPITVAPHPQWFTVSSLSGFTPPGPASGAEVIDPSAHDITWVWDFGDPTSEPHPSCNLPDAWRDTNIAYGKRVCHVFDGPGTYTVTCWAFDNDGHYGVATTTITVADPATFFPGNRTICVNPIGDTDFSLAIPGAQQIVGLANARDAAISAGGTSRILLKRGATFNGELPTAWSAANPNAYVAGNVYGTGADARIIAPAEFDGSLFNYHGVAGVACNRYIGLDYEGNWDVVSETGWNATPFNFIAGSQIGPFMLHKCRLRNSNGHSIGTDPTYHVIISSSLIENWRAFGLIPAGSGGAGANDRLAIIGSAMHQSIDASQGLFEAFFRHQLGNFNGPVRVGYMRHVHVSASSLFSNNGWSGDGGGPGGLVSEQAIQDAFRGNSDPGAYTNALPTLWNIERSYFEGNPPLQLMNKQGARPGNFVVDKCLLVSAAYTNNGHMVLTGGSTVRNCFFYAPNVQIERGVALGFMFSGVQSVGEAQAVSRRVRVYNNTFYGASTSANRVWYNPAQLAARGNIDIFEFPGGWTAFTDLVSENNVVHCPAQSSPITSAAPVNLVAILGVQTFYRGGRWSFRVIEFTLTADIPNGGSFTVPYPNDGPTQPNPDLRHPNGTATNQAYFLSPPGLNRHMLGFTNGGPRNLKSWGTSPQFSVTFGASNITITNTSGSTWLSGWGANVHLDRRNQNTARQVTGFASPATIEVPTPIAGSPALSNLTSGARAWDDFYTNVRIGQINRVGVTVSGNTSLGARDPVAG